MSEARDEQRRIVEESLLSLAAATRRDAVERKSIKLREEFKEFCRLQNLYLAKEGLEGDDAQLLLNTSLTGMVNSHLEAADEKLSDWKLVRTMKAEMKKALGIRKIIDGNMRMIENLLSKQFLNDNELDHAKDSIDMVEKGLNDFIKTQETILDLKEEMGENEEQYKADGDNWVDNLSLSLSIVRIAFPHAPGAHLTHHQSTDSASDDMTPQPDNTFISHVENSAMEQDERKLKCNLLWLSMNPIQQIWQRIKTPKKVTWKRIRLPCFMILGLILVLFLSTIQFWDVSSKQFDHVTFLRKQKDSIQNRFLKNLPDKGDLVANDKSECFSYIDHLVEAYKKNDNNSISSYLSSPLGLCVEHYGRSDSGKAELVTKCLHNTVESSKMWNGSERFLEKNRRTMPWPSIQRIFLNFSLLSDGPSNSPNCYMLKSTINFEKKSNGDQIPIKLSMASDRLKCLKNEQQEDESRETSFFYSMFCVIFCFICLGLCCSHLRKAQQLKWDVENHLKWNFSIEEQFDFVNPWCIFIFISIFLIIRALYLEISDSANDTKSDVSIILGTGNFMIGFSLLGYLGFCNVYQLLIKNILTKMLPQFLKFHTFAFGTFWLFVVLGNGLLSPYHHKFKTIGSTAEGLFSLVHGDDIFATFQDMSEESESILWWSKVYLFSFISVFILFFLAHFLALFNSNYDMCQVAVSDSRLEKFYINSQIDFSDEQADEGSGDSWMNFFRSNGRFLGKNRRGNVYEAL